MRTFYNYKN